MLIFQLYLSATRTFKFSDLKMKSWHAVLVAAVAGAFSFFSGAAIAQSVLLLTTNEAGHTAGNTNSVGALNNMESEFSLPGVQITRMSNVLSMNGGISASTFTNAATNQPYDIVLIGAAYGAILPSNWVILEAAMSTREANAFVMFMDGCPSCANNVAGLSTTLNNLTGLSVGVSGTDWTPNQQPFYLNTNSPFQSSFSTLNPIYGFATRYITNVPVDNILYKERLYDASSALNPPDPTTGTANAFGVIFPTSQVNNGEGACLFAVDDLSVFINSPDSGWQLNQGRIGPAFLDAVNAGGSCGIPGSISKSFSPTSVRPGGVATLTITVENQAQTNLTGVHITDELPSPLLVHGGLAAIATTCQGGDLTVSNDRSSFSLQGATVAPAGCTITVPVRWPAANANNCVEPDNVRTNTILPGIGFYTDQGQAASPAVATLTCDASQPATVAPVPSSDRWTLAALAMIVTGFVAAASIRRRKH